MKLLRLTLAAAALSAALAACDAARLTAPSGAPRGEEKDRTARPVVPGMRLDDQTMGSGG